jgi:CBS domain containing-hemolysin-like protein
MLLVLAVVLIGLSFLCSLLESIILSVQPAYIAIRIKEGFKSGHLLQHQKRNIDKAISAILILNAFSQTAGASFLGSQVYQIYGDFYLTIFSVIFTAVTLILAEVLPKSIGARNWKRLAPYAAYVIQFMIFFLYPFVWGVGKISQLLGGDSNQQMTREEMIMILEIGAKEGTLKQKEGTILRNLLMMENIFVSDIMTPRSVMLALDENLTVEEVGQQYKPIRYSRIPVYRDNIDNIVGMTHRFKIMEALSHDQDKVQLSELLTPIRTVSEHTTVSMVIDFFIKNKEHLAVAVDEFGVITGLVSLEDAVETLLGVEIVDELDTVADLRQYALDQWQQRKAQIRK